MQLHTARFIGLALIALALAGCSSPAATPTPHTAAAVDTSNWKPVTFSGTGTMNEEVRVPSGARSIDVEVACSASAQYSLSVGTERYGDRGGICDGAVTYRVGLGGLSDPEIFPQFRTYPDAPFALTITFSKDKLTVDPKFAAACTALSPIVSDVFNADEGYRRGDVTAQKWSSTFASAVKRLRELEPGTTGIIRTQIPLMIDGLSAQGLQPGAFASTSTPYQAAVDISRGTCTNGGSELTLWAKYGG